MVREGRDGGYEPRRAGVQRDTVGLALIGLIIVLSLLIAAAIALPAWASLDDPTATPPPPTVTAVGFVGAGPVTPTRHAPVAAA